MIFMQNLDFLVTQEQKYKGTTGHKAQKGTDNHQRLIHILVGTKTQISPSEKIQQETLSFL